MSGLEKHNYCSSDEDSSGSQQRGNQPWVRIVIVFIPVVICSILVVGWFQLGREISNLRSTNRRLKGELSLAEFEKKSLRETIGPLISRAYAEFPEEETTHAIKTIVARWASKDAMTRPITSVLAAVTIFITTDNPVDKQDTSKRGNLSLCYGSNKLLEIASDSFCARRTKVENVEYAGVFQMSPQELTADTPQDLLGKTNFITIEFDCPPDINQVTGGKVTIIFNTSEKFEFQIPSQELQDNKVIIHDINDVAESQLRSKNLINLPSKSKRPRPDPPNMEEISKIIGTYLKYASSAEVRGPLTIEQVEEERLHFSLEFNVVEQGWYDIHPDTLVLNNSEWVRFKSQLIAIDQIYYFISDKKSWSVLCGSAGYAIIREGQLVDTYITSCN